VSVTSSKDATISKAPRRSNWLHSDAANICTLICATNETKGRELWERVCQGDVEAATTAIFTAYNSARGRIIRVAYQQKVPAAAFGAMLSDGWDHDHHWLIRAANGTRGRRTLKCWFDRAAFDVSHLPNPVTVYRGGTIPPGRDWSFLATGISWTLKLETAAFFARRFPHMGDPTIVRATVPRTFIKAHMTSRDEDEVVILDLIKHVSLEPVPPGPTM